MTKPRVFVCFRLGQMTMVMVNSRWVDERPSDFLGYVQFLLKGGGGSDFLLSIFTPFSTLSVCLSIFTPRNFCPLFCPYSLKRSSQHIMLIIYTPQANTYLHSAPARARPHPHACSVDLHIVA